MLCYRFGVSRMMFGAHELLGLEVDARTMLYLELGMEFVFKT